VGRRTADKDTWRKKGQGQGKAVAVPRAMADKRSSRPRGKLTEEFSAKIVVNHLGPVGKGEVPEGLPTKFQSKSTFNTHDIMHSPVEKTFQMIDDILSGRRLFTM